MSTRVAAMVSWIGTINMCFCFLGQEEANAFKDTDKPTIFLVNKEMGYESRGSASTSASDTLSLGRHVNNWEAVAIRETFTSRGRGIFVTGNLDRGHKIIVEEPVFTAALPWPQSRWGSSIAQEWCRLPLDHQLRLKAVFRKRLRYVTTGSEKLGWFHRILLEDFMMEYAFVNPQKSLAHVYLLGSHINHACIRCANAQQWTDSAEPHRIRVTLVKPLKAGEEVFIHYNRQVGHSFGCAVCGRPSMMDQLKGLCGGVFGWTFDHTTTNTETARETDVSLTSQADGQSTLFSLSLKRGVNEMTDKVIKCWRFFTKRDGPQHRT